MHTAVISLLDTEKVISVLSACLGNLVTGAAVEVDFARKSIAFQSNHGQFDQQINKTFRSIEFGICWLSNRFFRNEMDRDQLN